MREGKANPLDDPWGCLLELVSSRKDRAFTIAWPCNLQIEWHSASRDGARAASAQ